MSILFLKHIFSFRIQRFTSPHKSLSETHLTSLQCSGFHVDPFSKHILTFSVQRSHRPINRYPTYTSHPQYSVFHINSIILLQHTCHTFSIECSTWTIKDLTETHFTPPVFSVSLRFDYPRPKNITHFCCPVFHIVSKSISATLFTPPVLRFHINPILLFRNTFHTSSIQCLTSMQIHYPRHTPHL